MSVRKGSYVIAGTPRTTGGVEIGDMGFAPLGIDESLNLRRYMNGQVISQTQFVSFTNKVKAAIALYPNLAATETNWQAEKTNSKLGQCGKFVIDDTAGTIRLPCVVNAQGLLGLSGIGNLVNESLPNINISSCGIGENNSMFHRTAGYPTSYVARGDGQSGLITEPFASLTSSSYQDNAPVQQEAVQYPYYIQVATGVEETLPAIREYQINTPFFFGQSMYSDVAPDNASWLVSNGQYNAKTVYPDYYNWLLERMNAGVSGFVASTAAYTDYDFVINTTDQTFRLPLKNGQEGVFADGVKGNGMTLGLTDGTKNGGLWFSTKYALDASTSSYGTTVGTATRDNPLNISKDVGVTNDPSKSGMIVDKTVPSGWNLYYYIGDTVQDASLINAGAVLGQLATKTNSVEAAAASMPSNRYIDLTLGASGSTYTAPANGYFSIYVEKGDSTQAVVRLENGSIIHQDTRGYGSTANLPLYSYIPVCKGQNVRCIHNYTGTFYWFRFVYAQGEQ